MQRPKRTVLFDTEVSTDHHAMSEALDLSSPGLSTAWGTSPGSEPTLDHYRAIAHPQLEVISEEDDDCQIEDITRHEGVVDCSRRYGRQWAATSSQQSFEFAKNVFLHTAYNADGTWQPPKQVYPASSSINGASIVPTWEDRNYQPDCESEYSEDAWVDDAPNETKWVPWTNQGIVNDEQRLQESRQASEADVHLLPLMLGADITRESSAVYPPPFHMQDHSKVLKPNSSRVQLIRPSIDRLVIPGSSGSSEVSTPVVVPNDAKFVLIYRPIFRPFWAETKASTRKYVAETSSLVRNKSVRLVSPIERVIAVSTGGLKTRWSLWKTRRALITESKSTTDFVYIIKPKEVGHMINKIYGNKTDRPKIGLDVHVYRDTQRTTISLLVVHDHRSQHVYLIDLLVMGSDAWLAHGSNQETLMSMLEDGNVTKLVYDCRTMSVNFLSTAGVKLQGVIDCQYLHMLSFKMSPSRRPKFNETVEQLAGLDPLEFATWNIDSGEPGQPESWLKRPIPPQAKWFTIQRVRLLERIHNKTKSLLTGRGFLAALLWSMHEVRATSQMGPDRSAQRGSIPELFEQTWSVQLAYDPIG